MLEAFDVPEVFAYVEVSVSADPVQHAFEAWLHHGKPTAQYVAQGERDVRAVRVLQAEITPQSVEIVRSFIVDGPPPFQCIRLLRAVEPEGRVCGWKEFYLLAGEHGLAGKVLNVNVDFEDYSQEFHVPSFLIVLAYALPLDERLEDWSDGQLADLVAALTARMGKDEAAARKNLAPVFHSEDELVSATVIPTQDAQYQLRLSFSLVIWPGHDTSYDYEAQAIPPSLRQHVEGEAVVQPNIAYPASDPLVAMCRDLVQGRIVHFSQPAWERSVGEHVPRRVVKVGLPSGRLAFSAGLDCAGRTALHEIVEKLKSRAAQP